MGRTKDLWINADGSKTPKHPANGGNKTAKRWQAVWNDPDGNEKTKVFAKKKQAEDHWKKMEGDADRGEYIDPKAGDELFGTVAAKYLRLRNVGGTTRDKYASSYRNQVEGVFAQRRIRAVKPSDVLEWLRSPAMMKLGVSRRYLAYMIVAGVFDLAVADGMRKDNPARSKIIEPPPKPEATHHEPWSPERVWQVHDAHPERYQAMVACAAGLGLREGETFALAEDDFDFDALKVHVCRQVARANGMEVFKLPKEDKDRWVPLSPLLALIVQAHLAAYPPRPYELPWMDEHGQIADKPHSCKLLFRWVSKDRRTHDKHVKSARYDQSVWSPALAALGIIEPPVQTERSGKQFQGGTNGNGTHALRRFFSTTLQDAGVSLSGVMDFMGHSKKGGARHAQRVRSRDRGDLRARPPGDRQEAVRAASGGVRRNCDGTGGRSVTGTNVPVQVTAIRDRQPSKCQYASRAS
jgi:integrase